MQHWERQMVQQTFVPCFRTEASFQHPAQRVDNTDVKDNISKCQHIPFTSFDYSESMEWEMTRANMSQNIYMDASGSFDSHASSDDLTAAQKPAFLRLPELVDLLAKEGQVLRWNELCSWYEVLDGPLFEEKFNALRCTRGKRKEQAVDRPFARLEHFHWMRCSSPLTPAAQDAQLLRPSPRREVGRHRIHLPTHRKE